MAGEGKATANVGKDVCSIPKDGFQINLIQLLAMNIRGSSRYFESGTVEVGRLRKHLRRREVTNLLTIIGGNWRAGKRNMWFDWRWRQFVDIRAKGLHMWVWRSYTTRLWLQTENCENLGGEMGRKICSECIRECSFLAGKEGDMHCCDVKWWKRKSGSNMACETCGNTRIEKWEKGWKEESGVSAVHVSNCTFRWFEEDSRLLL